MKASGPVEPRSSAIEAKTIATLRARAALAGVALHVIDDRGAPLFVASRWNLVRKMHSVDEVEAFLQRLSGARVS